MDKTSEKFFDGLWRLHDLNDENPEYMICGEAADHIKSLSEQIENTNSRIREYIKSKESLGSNLWDDEDDDFDKDGEAIYDQGRYQGWHEVCIEIQRILNDCTKN